MKEKLRHYLARDEISPFVLQKVDEENMVYGSWIGLLGIPVALFMLVWSYMPAYVPQSMDAEQASLWLLVHRSANFVLVAAMLMLLICSRLFLKAEKKSHILAESTTLTFAVAGLAVGVVVSSAEYFVGDSMSTLSILSVVIFCGLLLHPMVSLVLSAGTFGFLILAISVSPHGVNPALIVSICVLAAVFAGVSATRWYLRIRGARAEESRNELVDKFRQLSLVDELTGLGNRYAFREEYASFLYEPIVLLLCNVDDFHRFNEVYGRDKADGLLCRMADLLTEQFGISVYRYAADEFLVATTLSASEAKKRAQIVSASFREMSGGEKEFIPTFTGAYIYGKPIDEEMLRKILRAAEEKLYIAKSMGKNRIIGESYEDYLSAQTGNASQKGDLLEDVDSLTGLWSMEGFLKLAGQRINVVGERPEPEYFLYFNTENFKTFNEEYGYREGDAFLKHVARILLKVFPNELISRFADDRFVVFSNGLNVKEQLEEVYRSVYGYNDKTPLTIRAGIFEFDGKVEAAVACDRAKLACDSIKKRYDIHYTFYDESIRNRSILQQHILNTFDEALKDGRIKVCFQPVVRTLNDEVCGVEALTRWEDPVYGMLSPADFIETLEEFHLINQLDTFVVEKICENYNYLVDNGYPLLQFSVNLSRLDFELCDIVMTVKSILQRNRMPVHMLHIEVTENAFSGDQEFLRQEVTRFKEEGFQIWMDDFGSGYSSLNVLRYYPFDVIKLDMKFLEDFRDSEKSRTMLAYIVSLAKEYGIQTLAEGIETKEQFDYLRRIGCEMVQGYYLGVPHALVESASYLAKFAVRIEDIDSQDYYEACGRVNILRPHTIEEEGDVGLLGSELPFAVVEMREEKLRFFSYNDEFHTYLNELHMPDARAYESILNDAGSGMSSHLRTGIRAAMADGDWHSFEYAGPKDYYLAWIRHFATDEKSGANAFLLVVMNQSKYASVFRGRQYVAQGKGTVFRVL